MKEKTTSLDEYFAKYDTFTKTFVVNCGIGAGGLGDITRTVLYLLEICKQHNVRFYYNTNSSIFNYLIPKYQKLFIPYDVASSISEPIKIFKTSDIAHIEPNKFYIANPEIAYQDFCDNMLYNSFQYTLSDVFYFSDIVQANAKKYVKEDTAYISIHLRLGDKYLETDPKYVVCKRDARAFDEAALFSLIEKNAHKTIYFFCDNNKYKETIKDKYSFVNTINYPIGHTSLYNTTPVQILNTITDFYLLSKSEHIYSISWSVFPIMAANYKGTPITKYMLYNPDAYIV